MTLRSVPLSQLRAVCLGFFALAVAPMGSFSPAFGQSNLPPGSGCRVEAVEYKGWHAQQLSNRWVHAIVVPQNGGRLMQVTFAGHAYLFVNPKFAGKYLPPTSGEWFNYGGDKLWLLPEGNNDEQHWAGDSDVLDDGPFTFRKVSEGQRCEIALTGPADPHTGIQFLRTIRLDAVSPRIGFHAAMKNVTGHTVEWSMQSVSQYDTADPGSSNPGSSNPSPSNSGPSNSGPSDSSSSDSSPSNPNPAGPEPSNQSPSNQSPSNQRPSKPPTPLRFNHDFWTFTPANPSSSYLNRYHVRFGPAENSAVSVRDDGLFAVHYVHLAAELWVDSTEGWLAVVDGSSGYAMVERFEYEENKSYPGKASVIFWTNGPEVR